jgi:transposase
VAWRAATCGLDPAQLVFLDETSTPLTLTPLRARAPKGERAIGTIPRGHRRHVTLVGTLTSTGMGEAMVIAGAADRDGFEAFVDQVLAPSLQPGQTVILDNLSVHKSAPARRRSEEVGCTLCFLPRYSPDFNPIEQAFAKIKATLRRAEARTYDTLRDATKRARTAITPSDAASFFAEAGYPLTRQHI